MRWLLVFELLAGLALAAYVTRQAGRPDRFAGRRDATFGLVEVRTDPRHGWISVTGRRSTGEVASSGR